MKTTSIARYICALSITGLLAVSLTGCFGEDDADADPTLSPSPTPTPEWGADGGAAGADAEGGENSQSDEPEQANAEHDSDTELEPEPELEALEGAECLYGTWLADNDTALAGMRQFGDQIKSVEGDVYVEYREDGTFTSDYQDWTIFAQEQGVDVTVHRHGTDHGSFTATDTTITQSDEDMGAVITMTSAGMEMEVPAAPWTYTDAPYTCSESELVITTADGDSVLTR